MSTVKKLSLVLGMAMFFGLNGLSVQPYEVEGNMLDQETANLNLEEQNKDDFRGGTYWYYTQYYCQFYPTHPYCNYAPTYGAPWVYRYFTGGYPGYGAMFDYNTTTYGKGMKSYTLPTYYGTGMTKYNNFDAYSGKGKVTVKIKE